MDIISFDRQFDVNIEELPEESYMVSFGKEPSEAFVNALKGSLKIEQKYENITFCQLVLIENILNNVKEPREAIPLVLSVFYRPNDEKVFDNEDEAAESLKIASFKNFPAGAVFYMYNTMLERRDSFINEKYSGIIYSKKGSDSGEEVVDNIETRFSKAFFWYERQRSIAKELNMSMKDVLSMSADEALFELAYQANKAKVEEFRMKRKNLGK